MVVTSRTHSPSPGTWYYTELLNHPDSRDPVQTISYPILSGAWISALTLAELYRKLLDAGGGGVGEGQRGNELLAAADKSLSPGVPAERAAKTPRPGIQVLSRRHDFPPRLVAIPPCSRPSFPGERTLTGSLTAAQAGISPPQLECHGCCSFFLVKHNPAAPRCSLFISSIVLIRTLSCFPAPMLN